MSKKTKLCFYSASQAQQEHGITNYRWKAAIRELHLKPAREKARYAWSHDQVMQIKDAIKRQIA